MIVAGDSTGEAYGNGVVSWAASSPDIAQAELNVERGCGFVRDGDYLLDGEWFEVRDDCSDWLERDLPGRVAETGADVVLMVTTSWDVLDHRWDAGDGFATGDRRDAGATAVRLHPRDRGTAGRGCRRRRVGEGAASRTRCGSHVGPSRSSRLATPCCTR